MTRLLLCALLLLPVFAQAQPVNLGDYFLGDTVRCPWATYKPSTGDSIARATAGTATVYVDNGAGNGFNTVESATGLTDTSGFDSKTGAHVETVAATAANGFASGKDYAIMVQSTTITDTATVTINVWPCIFSIENHAPLKGWILGTFAEDSGRSSTVSQVFLPGNPITADNQYQFNRLWDVTDGWDRAIVSSNAASDYLSIYPDAPAAPTDQAVLRVTRDVVYPINFFDPATTGVTVTKMGASVGGATALTNNAGANFGSTFDQAGTPVSGTSHFISNIGANAAAGTAQSVWGYTIDGSTTAKCAEAIELAYAAGYWSTSGSVATFKDPTGTSQRIVGTVTSTSRGAITIACPP
jgi:hypothetical protein